MREIKKGTSLNEAPNQICKKYTIKDKLLSTLTKEPQTKWELSKKLNTDERVIRQAIEELRNEGIPIISSSHSKGYRIGTRQEAHLTALEYRARAYKMLRTATALELGEDVGQVSMEELYGI